MSIMFIGQSEDYASNQMIILVFPIMMTIMSRMVKKF